MNPELLDQPPPHSLHSERALTASILKRPAVFDEVAAIVTADDFHVPQCRLFYEHLLGMRDGVISAGAFLETFTPKEVESFGGRSELVAAIAETAEAVGSALEAPRHARVVAELSRRRAVINTCLAAVQDAYSGQADADALCSQTIQGVEEVANRCDQQRTARPRVTTVEEAERAFLKQLRECGPQLLSLGVPALDEAVGGGVEAGEMVVIGGLPSHGKSVNALQTARAMVEVGRNVVFVSHEMTPAQIAKRMIATRTYVDTDQWRACVDDFGRESVEFWKSAGKVFVITQCADVRSIQGEVGRLAAQHDVSLIVIDHCQLTRGTGRTRYEQQTDASGRYKELALRHDAVCLVLSQLNREAAKGEAEIHHLKETGSLEQDGDVVILVQWPSRIDPKVDPHKYVYRVTKNRNRAIVHNYVEAEFRPSQQTIKSPQPQRRSDF